MLDCGHFQDAKRAGLILSLGLDVYMFALISMMNSVCCSLALPLMSL